MNKTITILVLVLVFLGGFLVFYNTKPASLLPEESSLISDTQKGWESKVDDRASVTVTVTPTLLSEESGEWKFYIIMNTHSVELDQDMTQIAILVDEQGKEYKALNWDGPTGGHHREGVLTFRAITPTPKAIKLKVSLPAGVDRIFYWQVK